MIFIAIIKTEIYMELTKVWVLLWRQLWHNCTDSKR